MNAAVPSELQQVLFERRDAISRSWYQAVADTSFVPLKAGEVRERLTELTEQAITVLFTEPFAQDRAQAIGASLARLHYLHAEALGRTLEVLGKHLLEGLSGEQVEGLHSRLALLLGRLAAGFVDQTCNTVLAEQEQIRSAFVTELRRTESALRRAYDEIEGRVQERTVELAAANRALRLEIAERRQVEEAHRGSEEKWRTLVENAPERIMTIDREGTILFINRTLPGRLAEGVTGTSAYQYLAPREQEQLRQALESVFQQGESRRYESANVREDGTRVWYANSVAPIKSGPDTVAAILIATDVSERKRLEETLSRSLEETARGQGMLLALGKAAHAVQRARAPEEVHQRIGDEIAKLGYDAVVFELADDGLHLVVTHFTYDPESLQELQALFGRSAQPYRFQMAPGSLFQQMLSKGEAVYSSEPERYLAEALPGVTQPQIGHLAALLGIEQSIHAPLVLGDEIHGLLIVTGSDLRETDVQAVTAFANQTAIALTNARLYQEIRAWATELEARVAERTEDLSATNARLQAEVAERMRAEAELRHSQQEMQQNQRLLLALSQAAQAVQQVRTPEELYQTIGDEVERLGYRSLVFALDEDGQSMTIVHMTGKPSLLRAAEGLANLSVAGLRVPLAPDGFFRRLIMVGESAFCERTADLVTKGFPQLGRPLVERLITLLGMEQSIHAPLAIGRKTYGVLAVAGRGLTQADLQAVTVFANQAGIALENARLLEEQRASRAQLRQLAQELVSAQEEERRRLSRALHDEAGQALTALKISLELINEDLPADAGSLRQRTAEAVTLTDATMERVRSLAQDLRPPALDAVGLNRTLEGLCRDFAHRTQLPIGYVGADLPKLPDAANIALYRFLQEALTNVAKHAGARSVRVVLHHDAETVSLSVEDDGQGFDRWTALPGEGSSVGIGLLGMEERLEALGGSLSIESQPSQGARLVARVPSQEVYVD